MYLNTELFSCADGSLLPRDTKHVQPLFIVAAAWSPVVSTSAAIFSSLIDGCLKYKNKDVYRVASEGVDHRSTMALIIILIIIFLE